MSDPHRRIGHIDEEISAYAAHTSAGHTKPDDKPGGGGAGDGETPGSPYSSETLAAVYHPRVQQLLDLKAEGYTYAEWAWDATQGHNRWHGVPDHEVPEH
jgi:hypothetical protein